MRARSGKSPGEIWCSLCISAKMLPRLLMSSFLRESLPNIDGISFFKWLITYAWTCVIKHCIDIVLSITNTSTAEPIIWAVSSQVTYRGMESRVGVPKSPDFGAELESTPGTYCSLIAHWVYYYKVCGFDWLCYLKCVPSWYHFVANFIEIPQFRTEKGNFCQVILNT